MPPGWTPTADWHPDPDWGPPPPGWAFLRLSDCAADANLPLAYRDAPIDEKFRIYIDNPNHPAKSFVEYLGSIRDIIETTFRVSNEAARAGRIYREIALRSLIDATEIIERSLRTETPTPFVFFACVQDAMSAIKMFSAAVDLALGNPPQRDSHTTINSDTKSANDSPLSAMADLEKDASDQFQIVFDSTAKRVIAVLREALHESQFGGRRGTAARKALENSGEAKRLIEQVGSGRIELSEGLRIIDKLESIGRRVAAAVGTRF
ncbi:MULTISPECIES: hypothetical protein [unclassified Micromonospora]|uniref:hypothetical protein n=1 Tax=unclassified Micromonospora TaxID=2617518 RepID=UPI003A894425